MHRSDLDPSDHSKSIQNHIRPSVDNQKELRPIQDRLKLATSTDDLESVDVLQPKLISCSVVY